MAHDSGYVLAGAAADVESVRLAALEADRDPGTTRRLEAIGVERGWRCLEVGAGHGSIARWLGVQVGHRGHVVAADIDPRFLVGMADNIEVRTLDIRRDDVEPGAYDLVHSRALLMHLPDPGAALQRMVAALRPGGVLLAEEGDYGLVTYGGHPDAAWCTDLVRRQIEGLKAAGMMDGWLGRRLPSLLLDSGLDLLDGEVETSIARPGDAGFEFHRLTFESGAPALIRAGLMTDEDAARMAAVLAHPWVVITTASTVSAWGRRLVPPGTAR